MAIDTNTTNAGSTGISVEYYHAELKKATSAVTMAGEALRRQILTVLPKKDPGYPELAAQSGHLQYLEETTQKQVEDADVTIDGLAEVVHVLKSYRVFADNLYRAMESFSD